MNLYHGDDGSVANGIDPVRQGRDVAVIRDHEAVGNTTRTRDPGQIHARSCVAELAAGLSVAFVIQNHDRQVGGMLQSDGSEAAHCHVDTGAWTAGLVDQELRAR